jgi:hypothetical protein
MDEIRKTHYIFLLPAIAVGQPETAIGVMAERAASIGSYLSFQFKMY